MSQAQFSRSLVLFASIMLFTLGTLAGVIICLAINSAAANPKTDVEMTAARHLATPLAGTPVTIAGTPVPDHMGIAPVLRNATGAEVVDAALAGVTEEANRVNVFVEVNTFVGLGSISMGDDGISVHEADACEVQEDEVQEAEP